MTYSGESKQKIRLEKKAAKIGVKCINSFYYFFKTFWPEFSSELYVDNFHIKLICDILQEYGEAIARGDEIRKTLIINVPPGSSKSSLCTVAFPLYMWLIKPSCATVNISYSADLSKDHQELSKDIPSSKRWKLLFDNIFRVKHGEALTIPISNKNKVQNNFGGKRFNTSTGGALTGKHCDIIIEDDPLNPEQAHSDAERENSIRFHDKTVSTRKKNDNCYLNVIIAQRLHENDICGHVLKKNLDITHICLPGEITKNTPVIPESARKLYKDGILNPIRKGRLVLNDLKESLGSDGYAIQVLQLPFDLDNQDIKPEMFKKVHAKELPDDLIWDVWVDGAFTNKKDVNDPTGIDIIAKHGKQIFVRKAYDEWRKLPDLIKFIIDLEQDGMFDAVKSRIFVEPKASGYPLVQYLESDTEYNYVLIGEHNKREAKLIAQGKGARHEMIKPKAESGRIVLVEDGIDDSWIEGYITQLCGFPRAAHDEHVDTLGYAINHYYMSESSFVQQYAIDRLEKNVIGSILGNITSMKSGKKLSVSYDENEKVGDIQMFYDASHHYLYRYVCVLTLRAEGDRGGKTNILVYDRKLGSVAMYYESSDISPHKAGKKAVEIATLYDEAKLVVVVKDEVGASQNEECDLSHISLEEIRRNKYNNIYSRLSRNDIRMKREREYGYKVDRSSARELYYNLKDLMETGKIREITLEVLDEIKLLERKKETGEVTGKEGYETNAALSYSVALKVDGEMQDDVKIRPAK